MPALTWRALSSLMLAMFTVSVGYSIALPILPFLIERLSTANNPAAVSWHTGLLTSTYLLAAFLCAPLWGRLSDLWGRRVLLLFGLSGLGTSLLLFAFYESLLSLYIGRFLNGIFAAAVAPVAYALVGDHASSKEWRAHRFALLNVSITLGFFVGPLLGGFALLLSRELTSGGIEYFPAPFLAASTLTLIAAALIWTFVHAVQRQMVEPATATNRPNQRAIFLRLGAIVFISALAIGAFEIGLSLRGKQTLGMEAYQISMLFAECSIVMLVVQAFVLSPLIKPDATRWLLTPGLAVLAVGLALVPLASGYGTTTVTVALVAASAGILTPIATFWVSLKAGEIQGAQLGRITAEQNLGQVLGSAGGGLLFGVSSFPNATFQATSLIVLTGIAAAYGLPSLLVRSGEGRSTGG